MKLYSFDVFDTLIKRKTGEPDGIFRIMQQRLIKNDGILKKECAADFYERRRDAEKIARILNCKGDVEEITLRQIYETMCQLGWIEPETIDRLMILEQETELEQAVPEEKTIARLEKYLASGNRTIAISDMYVDRMFIEKLFRQTHIPVIPVYVSSESKLCKWTGSLYRYIHMREAVPYSEWHHIGDNQHSDYEEARRLGIDAELYKPEQGENDFFLGKIVLYGAGKLGNHIKRQIDERDSCELVLWVDRWYMECQSRGLDVAAPQSIAYAEWDRIIIAVVDRKKYEDIMKELCQMGVDKEKICWIHTF